MADESSLDPGTLLRVLATHEVDYVLIGGVAVQAYGHVRTTLDLDVIAAWTPENTRRLAGALGELDARLRGVDADRLGIDPTDPEHVYAGGNFFLHTRHGDLDVFAVEQTVGAPRSYAQLRRRALEVNVMGVRLALAHPEHLIRMKRASSELPNRSDDKRLQDRQDIALLERARARGFR